MTGDRPPGLWNQIPPPVVFLAAFFAGWALQRWLWPASRLGGPERMVGAALMAIAFGGELVTMVLFGRHHTTLIPFGEPRFLIVSGPYRLTRNPIYLLQALFYLGAVLWSAAWLALALLALPLAFLARVVVPMEEEHLERTFGAEYRAYQARVRRWL